ncbi:MAG: NAD-dependent epimerase/dehydratase family protein, partial [Myxococcales bacterium]
VYSSSVAAYGVTPGHSLPMVEDTPRRYVPEFAYSATKFEVEAFLDAFEPAHPEMTFARLRPTILIGTRMEHTLGPLIRRNTLVLPDAAPLPIVWDEDVADAALLAMHQRARGAFNLSADEPLVASKLAKAAGMRSFRVPRTVARAAARMAPAFARVGLGKSIDPAWAAAMEVSIDVSSDRAKRQLGWNPSCPTSGDVFRRYVHVASQGLDLRLGLLLRAAKLYTSPLPEEHQGAHVLVHVALTGEHGGDLTLALERGQNRVVVSQIPRPPASTVTLPASLLLDLLAGRGTLEQALREGTVQWEGASVGTVALAAVVEGFRASQDAAGARRVLCRAVARCL